MKVVGFSRCTRRPSTMAQPRSPCTCSTGCMLTAHLLAISSTARNPELPVRQGRRGQSSPMLWRVCSYFDPGFPCKDGEEAIRPGAEGAGRDEG
eukprot:154345-Hanusia_phi.AAC.2